MLDSSSNQVIESAALATAPEGTPTSALDAVEAALKAGSSSEASRAEGEQPVKPEEAASDGPKSSDLSSGPDEVPEEELRAYSARAQERIRELVGVKNDLRSQVETLQAQIEPLRVQAARMEAFTDYLVESGIDANEAKNAIEITRLIKKHHYALAYEIMTPIYAELAKRSGAVLDADLDEEVRAGTLPADRAGELQRARALKAVSSSKNPPPSSRAFEDEADNDDARVDRARAAAEAADAWALEKAQSIENWDVLAELVAAEVKVLISREGFPPDIAGVTDLNERALAKVRKTLARAKPSRADLPNSPKTPLEALELGLSSTAA